MENIISLDRKPDLKTILAQCGAIILVVLGCGTIFSVVAAALGSLIAGVKMGELSNISASSSEAVIFGGKIFQMISTIGIFLVPALVLPLLLYRIPPGRYFGMNRKTPFVLFILALIAYFALTPFLEWTIQLNQEMALPSFLKGLESWMKTSEEQAKVITEVFVKMPTFGSFLFTVFYMALLPAIAEEFLFRGFLQRTIFNWTRKINLSIIISAFVFSFIHFQFYGFLPRMLLGMLLGYLFYWSGNLKLSVFIHFMNNFLSILVTYIQQNEKIDLDPDKMPANPWLIVFSIVSGAIMLYGIYKTGQRKNIEFANRNVADDDARNPELKWKKVYSTPKLYQAEIFLGKLRNEGLRAVLKNKKDSAYTVFGTVEIYVPEEEEAQANSIIESKE